MTLLLEGGVVVVVVVPVVDSRPANVMVDSRKMHCTVAKRRVTG